MRPLKVFRVLLSFFLLIKRRDSFLGITPLPPDRLKATIVELGASFIKLAQVLATRADFFNKEYLEALKSLHDELPPMPKELVESHFAQLQKIPFTSFDPTPIASASIGQVHVGYLQGGTKVAVKLRRVGIKDRIEKDIKLLRFFLFLFQPLFSPYTKNSLEAVLAEFSSMILKEIDFTQEVRNLKKFSKTYADMEVLFPGVFEEYCDEEVIVMEFMEGVRFDDKERLSKLGIDFHPLIDKLVRFYAEQMLVKGFFHADPHPGNLLVNEEGELILLDFGMVKQIPNETRIAIIELIKAANERDFELYVSAAKRLGVIAYEAPNAVVAEFVERMFEIFENEHLKAIDMQRLAFEVLASMRDLPFKLPQEAVYILRVSAIIEGLGTTFIENFNGIKDILPILQENIPRALGYKSSILEMIIEEIKETPYLVRDFKETVKLASEGSLKVEMSPMQLEFLQKETKQQLRRYAQSFALMMFGIFLLEAGAPLWVAASVFGVAFLRVMF